MVFPGYEAIFQKIGSMFRSHPIGDILKTLAESEHDICTFVIRKGDLGNDDTEGDNGYGVAVIETVVVGLLVYLKNLTNTLGGEPEDGGDDKRYKQHPIDTKDTWGGFHIDDWFRAVAHLIYFLDRRKGKTALDASGPKNNKASPVFIFRSKDKKGILREEEHENVASDVAARKTLSMLQSQGSVTMKMGSKADRLKIYDNGEATERMHRRSVMLSGTHAWRLKQDALGKLSP